MKLYIKVFLVMGVTFAVLMTVFAEPAENTQDMVFKFIFYGVFYGGFMSLILVTTHKLKTKNLSSKDDPDVLPHQTKIITLDKTDLETAFAKSLNALEQVGATVKQADKSKFEIQATSKMSWISWGEKLSIRLKHSENDATILEVSSAPKMPFMLLDHGKGKENVETLAVAILR